MCGYLRLVLARCVLTRKLADCVGLSSQIGSGLRQVCCWSDHGLLCTSSSFRELVTVYPNVPLEALLVHVCSPHQRIPCLWQ